MEIILKINIRLIQTFWKKNEREEKIQKRAQEKVEQEQRKQDIELIEENIINSGLKIILWPNLKNLSGGLNLSRGLNMVGST